MSKKSNKYSIYYAGHLFDFKHLTGNLALSKAIKKLSKGKYSCILPQDLEQTDARSVAIRDSDLYTLIKCDLALFHFDGTEVDSGTVVEFIIAKMLNIPSVIVRTDFRQGGDQEKDGDPWNLMMSGYPFTRTLLFHSMAIYQSNGVKGMNNHIASSVVETLDQLLKQVELEHKKNSKLPSREVHWLFKQYELVVARCGDSLKELLPTDTLFNIVSNKYKKLSVPPVIDREFDGFNL